MNDIENIEHSQEYYHWLLERYEELRKLLIYNYTRHHYEQERLLAERGECVADCLLCEDDLMHCDLDPFYMDFHELLKAANNRLVARIERLKYHCQCDTCNLGNEYAMTIASEEYETTDDEIQESIEKKADELNKLYDDGVEKFDFVKSLEHKKSCKRLNCDPKYHNSEESK